MNIHEIKRRNVAHGGCFFERNSLTITGDRVKHFGVKTINRSLVIVYRKNRKGAWVFHSATGRVITCIETC